MKKIFLVLGTLFLLMYPLMMYVGLTHLQPKTMVLVIVIVVGLQVLSLKSVHRGLPRVWTMGLVALLSVLVWISNDSRYFLYYPFCVNVVMLILFGTSLFHPPSFIERISERTRKDPITPAIQKYMRRLTKIWCLFFILNGLIALFTALFAPLSVWAMYNGIVAYIFIGSLFLGEICFRKLTKRESRG